MYKYPYCSRQWQLGTLTGSQMFSTNAFALLTVAHPARMKCGTGRFSFQSKAVVSVANPGKYRHASMCDCGSGKERVENFIWVQDSTFRSTGTRYGSYFGYYDYMRE